MNFESNIVYNKPEQSKQEAGMEKSRLFDVLAKNEEELFENAEHKEKLRNFGKAVRAITAALAFLNAAPALAQAETLGPQEWKIYQERMAAGLGESDFENMEIEKNIENFGIKGLRIGRVSQAGSDRGRHYQRGVYLKGEHLGDIIYRKGAVVDVNFFLDRVHQILTEHGFPDRFAPEKK